MKNRPLGSSSHWLSRCVRSAHRLGWLGAFALAVSTASAQLGISTIAGSALQSGFNDATGSSARFANPSGVAVDAAGNIYVADAVNHRIRKVTPAGVVTTVAGSGSAGSADLTGTLATFNFPQAIAIDPAAANLYVADTSNHKIRKIVISTGVVSTLAGTGAVGSADNATGTSASFNSPMGLVVDGSNANVYVADTQNSTIRQISLSGASAVTTLAGQAGSPALTNGSGTSARFRNPQGLSISGGTLYVADTQNHAIRSVVISGASVTTLAGSGSNGIVDGTGAGASFNYPTGVAVSGLNVFVTDTSNNTLRQVVISSGVVTTVAGVANSAGNADGVGTSARFQGLSGIGVDGSGVIYVADTINQTIRRAGSTAAPSITSSNAVTLPIGAAGSFTVTGTGSPAATFTVGSGFPSWATFTSNVGANTATISGTPPNGVGSPFTFTITATNGVGSPATQSFTLTVQQGPAITSANNTTFALNTAGSFTVTGTGSPASTFTVGSGFPPWATFTSNAGANTATITGTPLNTTGSPFSFTVTATNGVGSPATQAFTLTVSTGVAISTQPANTTVTAGLNATFSVGATATPSPTYQWQRQPAAGGGFTNLAEGGTYTGTTSSTLTVNTVSAPMNGDQFQVIVSNGVGSPVTSSAATLSVAAAPVITSAAATSFIVAFPGSFTVTASGTPAPTFSITGGTFPSWASINTVTGAITGTPPDQTGSPFVFVVTATNAVSTSSQTFSLTVNPVSAVPTFTANPSNLTVTSGQSASFTGNAIASPLPTLRWQRLAYGTLLGFVDLNDDATYSGVTTTTLAINTTTAVMNGDQFRLVATNTNGSVVSSTATLTVNSNPPVITLNPVAVIANAGGNLTFTGSASGTPTPDLRWQRQPSGTTGFVNLVDGGVFTGTGSGTLVVTGVTAGMNGDQFRLAATNSGGTAYTTAATLTVNLGTSISTFAGQAGVTGSLDGVGTAARFTGPASIAVDTAGDFYIADTGNSVIRKMTANGVVTTLAGLAGSRGSTDGVGSEARFNSPGGIAVDSIGNVYVADTFSHTIRVVSPAGVVTTLAGSPGLSGAVDGVGSAARFSLPSGITVDSTGGVFVADTNNHAIRRVSLNGTVTTYAGSMGAAGLLDSGVATSARFNAPYALAAGAGGTIYVADAQNHSIRKITNLGAVSTLAGSPTGTPGSADGIGAAATFSRPSGLAVDSSGNVYVADTNNHLIRRITPAGEVSALAGFAGVLGTTDGTGSQARFNRPFGVVVDTNGNIYVADTGNNTIRRTGTTTAVQITTQPASRAAGVGQTTTLTVAATGSPSPTSYQWQRQAAGTSGFVNLGTDANYSGAGTATLVITNVNSAMSGDQFRVVVANGVNPAATSDVATLTIGTPPAFTNAAAASFRALEAGSFTFTTDSTTAVTFSATGLPSWATLNSSTGVLSGTAPDTTGSPFAIGVTANNGVSATQAFTLTVLPANLPPTIAAQPANASVNPGQAATFSVTVTGTAPFTYQWRRDNAPISGATTASLTLNGIQAASAGVYSVVITNTAGTVTSTGATLVVNTLPVITAQPRTQVALVNTSAVFGVTAIGGSGYSYQWRKNGVAIPGANASSLSIAVSSAADAGNFDVIVTNNVGSTYSSLAQLTVTTVPAAPVITAQPASRAVAAGSAVTLSVAASAAPAPTYQWRKNGVPIVGANSTSYAFASAQSGDTAAYDVIVVNSAGSVTSAAANLRVFPRSYAGIYFGTFGGGLGSFALWVRDDNTGAFLGYLPGSTAPVMNLGITLNDGGQFSFQQGAIVATAAAADGEPARAAALSAVTVAGSVAADGGVSGSILGGANGTLSGTRSSDSGPTQNVAGFYAAGSATNAATIYTIVGANGQAFAVTQSGNASDGGTGTVTNAGLVSISTARSIITESINASAGTLTGTSAGSVTAVFAGGSSTAVALQRLGNISSRARVGSADAVAIAGFVISGTESKPVLIRAVGPTLGAAPFNVSGVLTTPSLELFRGATSIATNTGIGTNRAAIDAAGQLAGAFGLGAAGTDAAILTTLAPGNYTAVVSSTTNAAGVALVEVYDLSGVTAGQKLLNISTRAAVGTGENLLIAGFVVPPGTTKRVLVRGVGPGLSVFGVAGVLAQPTLTLYSGTTSVATNTNWSSSADAAVITTASASVGAFGLSNNDSALVVTLAPGNYTAQVTGPGTATGVALIEVYELP